MTHPPSHPRASPGSEPARPPRTLAALAELLGGEVVGPGEREVDGVAPLREAGPGELGFLADRKYLRDFEESGAGALLVSRELTDALPDGGWAGIVVPDARRALALLIAHLHPEIRPLPGIHPTAVLGRGVELGAGVSIGPYVVVEDGASIGDGVILEAHVVVGRGTRIGAGSWLHPQVVLYSGVVLGERVILHAGVRVGVDGFGYVLQDGEPRKIPQVGACVVEDDVEVGANSTLDRGSIGRTVVGAGTKLDNLVHLAHNVHVGPRSLMAAMVGIAGSTRIGAGVVMGGQSGAIGHLEIGDGVQVSAQAGLTGDVPAGETMSGFPARPHREFLPAMAALYRIRDDRRALERRLRTLEARLAALEGGGTADGTTGGG